MIPFERVLSTLCASTRDPPEGGRATHGFRGEGRGGREEGEGENGDEGGKRRRRGKGGEREDNGEIKL